MIHVAATGGLANIGQPYSLTTTTINSCFRAANLDKVLRYRSIRNAAAALLDDVGQLVCKELLPFRAIRLILAGRDMDFGAGRVGRRADHSRAMIVVNRHV